MRNWLIGAASTIGPAHIRRGMPNQDAVLVRPDTLTPRQTILGALSDGHGAAAHFRSDRGARIATATSLEALDWAFDGVEALDLEELTEAITTGWRNNVDADITQNPYDRSISQLYHPYGATVLAVAADSDQVCLFQLGDGDILLGYPDGRIERPLPSDLGLRGEQTYSLCMPDAARYAKTWFAHRDWDDELPDFIFVATDGVSKSLRSETDFRNLAAQYYERCRRGQAVFAETISVLPDWLHDLVENGSGDDATIILAIRADVQESRDDGS